MPEPRSLHAVSARARKVVPAWNDGWERSGSEGASVWSGRAFGYGTGLLLAVSSLACGRGGGLPSRSWRGRRRASSRALPR
jgi:hypothetical protein